MQHSPALRFSVVISRCLRRRNSLRCHRTGGRHAVSPLFRRRSSSPDNYLKFLT